MKTNLNFLIAMLLSFGVVWGWQHFYVRPHEEQYKQTSQIKHNGVAESAIPSAGNNISIKPVVKHSSNKVGQTGLAGQLADQRVKLDTPMLHGSVNLVGSRFDDLSLKQYHVTVDKNSPEIQLLTASGSPQSYIAEFGFIAPDDKNLVLPQSTTQWTIDSKTPVLSVQTPIHLIYNSPSGLQFNRWISIDKQYMFGIEDKVTNNSKATANIAPYSRVARAAIPANAQSTYLLHEGLIGVMGDDGLQEKKYADLAKLEPNSLGQMKLDFESAQGGFVGITDKYWAVTTIPSQNTTFSSRFVYFDNLPEHFQADLTQKTIALAPHQTISVTNHLFAGAKKASIIDTYQNSLKIKKFDLLIDWGLFSFITRPMFTLIDFLYNLTGNFGVAIVLVTIILKVILFPLANKSYKSMAKMKLLQPKLNAIKVKFPDDKAKQQQAIMELYRKEKINPVAGCLPMIIQMPIFFALYKVLYITIEMRHAPFFGWINDLAAPDPTSIFNLFGALPYHLPHFLMIGAWPVIMGITMFLQMRLNPTPTESAQAALFTWMPLLFTFMLSSFPVGLVIYWACNNTLTIVQQLAIMKKEGAQIDFWQNIQSAFKRK